MANNSLYNPRFFHGMNLLAGIGKFSGFTIAYYRTHSGVFFSWSLVKNSDPYNKAIGREISQARLDKNVEFIPVQINSGVLIENIDTVKNIGFLPAQNLKNCISAYVADHILEKMTAMDFKHNFIGLVLSDRLLDIYTDN